MRVLPALIVVVSTAHGATFTVNSTLDSDDSAADGRCDDGAGHCTLRAAITESNRDSAADIVQFNIAGAGVHTIQLSSNPLPAITQPLAIDARTQPGYSGTPLIDLSGNAVMNGLTVAVGNTSFAISGLVVRNFTGVGILVNSGVGTISSNFVGTDATGTHVEANQWGIQVNWA